MKNKRKNNMKKLILTLLLILSTSIHYTYAEEPIAFKAFAITAFKRPVCDKNIIFTGTSEDIISIDFKSKAISIYDAKYDKIFIYRIDDAATYDDRTEFYTIDDKNRNVTITFSKYVELKSFMFIFAYETHVMSYLTKKIIFVNKKD